MCECRDCDNFKAKKREPQVGDTVKCVDPHPDYFGRSGTVGAINVKYSFVDGSEFDEKGCLVSFKGKEGEKIVFIENVYLTVIE